MASQPLTNVQEELLKLYSQNLSPEEMKELKSVLAKFFASKAVKKANEIWDEKKYSNNTMDTWLNEG
ncbi:MAG: hypothetical protein Q8N03_15070 [Ignavibacteria bacterium]|nr:hypothetical protein [Ignavibacteria bacterium]